MFSCQNLQKGRLRSYISATISGRTKNDFQRRIEGHTPVFEKARPKSGAGRDLTLYEPLGRDGGNNRARSNTPLLEETNSPGTQRGAMRDRDGRRRSKNPVNDRG